MPAVQQRGLELKATTHTQPLHPPTLELYSTTIAALGFSEQGTHLSAAVYTDENGSTPAMIWDCSQLGCGVENEGRTRHDKYKEGR